MSWVTATGRPLRTTLAGLIASSSVSTPASDVGTGRQATATELERLWTTNAVARRGLTGVDAEYLEVYVDVA